MMVVTVEGRVHRFSVGPVFETLRDTSTAKQQPCHDHHHGYYVQQYSARCLLTVLVVDGGDVDRLAFYRHGCLVVRSVPGVVNAAA